MPFLYGNHVVKAHLGRITEDTPEHQGVVVFSMSDVPLVSRAVLAVEWRRLTAVSQGFGVTARSTVDTRKLDPTAIIVFHQADVGEYLRDEVLPGHTLCAQLIDLVSTGNTVLEESHHYDSNIAHAMCTFTFGTFFRSCHSCLGETVDPLPPSIRRFGVDYVQIYKYNIRINIGKFS
jgi:UPF0113 PUA domain